MLILRAKKVGRLTRDTIAEPDRVFTGDAEQAVVSREQYAGRQRYSYTAGFG